MIYFFSETESAHDQLTELFDFVWPTATGMWNLRWQVIGYVQALGDVTVEQLRARFQEGADIHGANLRRACIDHSWERQKESFAKILLINTFAIYEAWIEAVLEAIGKSNQKYIKLLQTPSVASTTGGKNGIELGIESIKSTESKPLMEAFGVALRRGKYYRGSQIASMMLWYRYFKEVRNCYVHRGGLATQRVVDAEAELAKTSTTTVLGIKELPRYVPAILGVPMGISLRGVVGFSHIVLMIIATLDAELAGSSGAEVAFLKKWKLTHTSALCVPTDPARRVAAASRLTVKAGFPKPDKAAEFEEWLHKKSLILH